jgi:hypothetical protein
VAQLRRLRIRASTDSKPVFALKTRSRSTARLVAMEAIQVVGQKEIRKTRTSENTLAVRLYGLLLIACLVAVVLSAILTAPVGVGGVPSPNPGQRSTAPAPVPGPLPG